MTITAATTRLTSIPSPRELIEQTGTAPLTSTVAVTFTDLDLSDVGHRAPLRTRRRPAPPTAWR